MENNGLMTDSTSRLGRKTERKARVMSNHSPEWKAKGPAVKVTKVSFVNPASHARLAGLLFEPESERAAARRPGVVVVGPMFSVKEQAASVYARRMAELGYVAIAFDHTSFGESEGEPRLNEDPFMKAEDAKSAVTYLSACRRSIRELHRRRRRLRRRWIPSARSCFGSTHQGPGEHRPAHRRQRAGRVRLRRALWEGREGPRGSACGRDWPMSEDSRRST